MNLYIGNLSKQTTDIELEKKFAGYGYVKSCKIIRDLFNGESKGFAFVEMPDNNEASTAMRELNGVDLNGIKMAVSEARPKNTDRNKGGSGGGRQGNNRFGTKRR